MRVKSCEIHMLITTQVATAPCTDPITTQVATAPCTDPIKPRSLPLPVLTRSKPTCVQKSPANSYLHEVRLNLIEPHVSDAVFLPVFVIEVPPFGFEDGEAFRFHFPAQ